MFPTAIWLFIVSHLPTDSNSTSTVVGAQEGLEKKVHLFPCIFFKMGVIDRVIFLSLDSIENEGVSIVLFRRTDRNFLREIDHADIDLQDLKHPSAEEVIQCSLENELKVACFIQPQAST